MAQFDFASLKMAMETGNGAALIGLYADDAVMTVVDTAHPPTSPMTVKGKDAIAAFWSDVCGRDMTHRVSHEVIGADRAAFVEECAYPDGCRVMAAMNLDLRDGRIVHHLTVQAWS